MELVTSADDYVVREPYLHDATLEVVLVERQRATFTFKTGNGRKVEIRLEDLRGMCIDGLLQSNIVFEMRVRPAVSAHEQDFRRLLQQSPESPFDNSIVNKWIGDGLVVAQIDPVVGADVIAICKTISWDTLMHA